MTRHVLIFGFILFSALILAGCKKISPNVGPPGQSPAGQVQNNNKFKFENPKKSAHYESNTPAHGAVLAGVPINVVIDFNFDLAEGSAISIKNDGREYGIADVVIDKNKLAMRRKMDPAAPDGVYTVSYKACWPDGSCHEGNFQFAIDRTKSQSYEDMVGKSEVIVGLSEISFKPMNLKIKKGTKVVWINDDNVEHYVNTDSHPAHTYYLSQNSKSLASGDSYSLTFNEAGVYPYHCSAHASNMTGSILVE
ncbi:copper resistance protein CopC [Candidatus Curtissbacteria bacterium]|nr:copper resistance protein CopC [Candidatus Curtissbacteria bacterium]